MPRGGKRPGSGRKKGSREKAKIIAEVKAGGITPLEYFLNILRSPDSSDKEKMAAAFHAAPYCHPRLNSINHSGGMNITSHEQALDEIEKGPPDVASE